MTTKNPNNYTRFIYTGKISLRVTSEKVRSWRTFNIKYFYNFRNFYLILLYFDNHKKQ